MQWLAAAKDDASPTEAPAYVTEALQAELDQALQAIPERPKPSNQGGATSIRHSIARRVAIIAREGTNRAYSFHKAFQTSLLSLINYII